MKDRLIVKADHIVRHNLIEGQYTLAPQVTGYIFASVSTTNHCQALSRCKGAYPHPESMSKCIIEVNKRELIRQYLLNLAPSTSPETPNILEPHLQLVLPGKSPLPSSSGSSLPHPLQISPLGQEDYYTARSGVDVLGMLKSPLVLMMLFSGVMMFALPKLMVRVRSFLLHLKKFGSTVKGANVIRPVWMPIRSSRRKWRKRENE